MIMAATILPTRQKERKNEREREEEKTLMDMTTKEGKKTRRATANRASSSVEEKPLILVPYPES